MLSQLFETWFLRSFGAATDRAGHGDCAADAALPAQHRRVQVGDCGDGGVRRRRHPGVLCGKAVQVDIRLTLELKALGCQPVESTYVSKLWFQMSTCTPCTAAMKDLGKTLSFTIRQGLRQIEHDHHTGEIYHKELNNYGQITIWNYYMP